MAKKPTVRKKGRKKERESSLNTKKKSCLNPEIFLTFCF